MINIHCIPARLALAISVAHKNLEVTIHLEQMLKMVELVVQEHPVEHQPLDYPKESACLEPEERPHPTPLLTEVQQVVVVHRQLKETGAHLTKHPT